CPPFIQACFANDNHSGVDQAGDNGPARKNRSIVEEDGKIRQHFGDAQGRLRIVKLEYCLVPGYPQQARPNLHALAVVADNQTFFHSRGAFDIHFRLRAAKTVPKPSARPKTLTTLLAYGDYLKRKTKAQKQAEQADRR